MSRIEPTPGRVVYFFPTKQGCPGQWPGDGVPLAATIVYVHKDSNLVNLSVHEMNGVIAPRRDVPLLQEGDIFPTMGDVWEFCTWMPYQIQAAKKSSGGEISGKSGAEQGGQHQENLHEVSGDEVSG